MSVVATPQGEADKIGPGRLILVVGPSGSGKDTLIRAARAHFAGREDLVFPHRIVTRPASEAEDNEVTTPADFAAIQTEGGFAISWTAHGLHYGIPSSINDAIGAGKTVICNVSRTMIPVLRRDYSNVAVIEITAPPNVLAERIAMRGRELDLEARLARSAAFGDLSPDMSISNTGPLSEVIRLFHGAISR